MGPSTSLAVTFLAGALKRAADEHGRPNSFGAIELHAFHDGPAPAWARRIGRTDHLRVALWERLGGRDGWGSCPTYAKGRFYV